jgi:hypothetical protein
LFEACREEEEGPAGQSRSFLGSVLGSFGRVVKKEKSLRLVWLHAVLSSEEFLRGRELKRKGSLSWDVAVLLLLWNLRTERWEDGGSTSTRLFLEEGTLEERDGKELKGWEDDDGGGDVL